MAKENIFLGTLAILFGIGIFIKTEQIIPLIILIAIGLGLIVFYKEENKIEQRKDMGGTRQTKRKLSHKKPPAS
jgi:hypothetical protein